jgi:hypothetical protein
MGLFVIKAYEMGKLKVGVASLVAGASMALCMANVQGGVLGSSDDFSSWLVLPSDAQTLRDFADGGQPTARQFTPTRLPGGARLRFDGKLTNSIRGPVRRDLDFDLPGASGSSSTVSFGSALFQLDLPFLRFDEATATYAFKETWKAQSLGDALFGENEISLSDIDSWEDFVGTQRIIYDMEGRRIDGSWSNAIRGESPLISSAIFIERDDEYSGNGGLVSAFGGMTLTEEEGLLSSEIGIPGVLAMLGLAALALFITLEITRDKLDRFR